MLHLDQRIEAFAKLGNLLEYIAYGKTKTVSEDIKYRKYIENLKDLMLHSNSYNGWFTEDSVRYMLKTVGVGLSRDNLNRWIKMYRSDFSVTQQKTIAVIMAGNIPAVGFHDLLCVLISGNRVRAKLSGDDNRLIPAIVDLLVAIEPGFSNTCEFTEERLSGFDAVIATGSNNTSRYFEYYFGKYKNLIRKNRNGVAVLTGNENNEELEALGNDIFTYYGLGCRNISKIMVPKQYDFTNLVSILSKNSPVTENHKYFNNYEYNKAIYIVNGTKHYDSGNLLLVENDQISSPVSVLYYQYYNNIDELENYLNTNEKNIQCIVTGSPLHFESVAFGNSQHPELWDYADGVDTLYFLLSLG